MFRITGTLSRAACKTPGVTTAREARLHRFGTGVRPTKQLRCHAEMEVDMKVGGMTCKHCTASVEKALEDSSDVVQVKQVDLDSGIVSVFVDADSQIDALDKLPALCQTIEGIGFTAEPYFGGAGGLGADP